MSITGPVLPTVDGYLYSLNADLATLLNITSPNQIQPYMLTIIATLIKDLAGALAELSKSTDPNDKKAAGSGDYTTLIDDLEKSPIGNLVADAEEPDPNHQDLADDICNMVTQGFMNGKLLPAMRQFMTDFPAKA